MKSVPTKSSRQPHSATTSAPPDSTYSWAFGPAGSEYLFAPLTNAPSAAANTHAASPDQHHPLPTTPTAAALSAFPE